MSAQLIYDQQERLLAWAEGKIGVSRFREAAKAIGLERDGELAAVVVYDGFSACDCNMHIASDGTGRWMNRALLVAAFAYPFVQLGLRRVTGLVPAKNAVALAFDSHLGFEFEGVCREALPDDDIVILGLLRRKCRFIPKEYRDA